MGKELICKNATRYYHNASEKLISCNSKGKKKLEKSKKLLFFLSDYCCDFLLLWKFKLRKNSSYPWNSATDYKLHTYISWLLTIGSSNHIYAITQTTNNSSVINVVKTYAYGMGKEEGTVLLVSWRLKRVHDHSSL